MVGPVAAKAGIGEDGADVAVEALDAASKFDDEV